ncbi:MAG: HAD family hydrolase [Candidatus Omnitrophica bacterium]|nr:HAD family hydrolase [Candidatus Omnitrophota bacterium]
MKKIRLVIFDIDGTLADAYAAINASFNYTMLRMGYSRRTDAVIRRAVGWGDENLLKPFIKQKDIDEALKIYRRHHKKALVGPGVRLLPNARSLLLRLKRKKLKLAVASNRPTEFSMILLKHLKIDKYFDYILCADKLKRAKPYPDILNKIMRKLSVRPAEAIYVGDMALDAQTGKRAGVKTLIVATGVHRLSLDSLGLR